VSMTAFSGGCEDGLRRERERAGRCLGRRGHSAAPHSESNSCCVSRVIQERCAALQVGVHVASTRHSLDAYDRSVDAALPSELEELVAAQRRCPRVRPGSVRRDIRAGLACARLRASAKRSHTFVSNAARRAVGHAGVGRCGAPASPLVQGRVGRCPTGSKSRVASRLKPSDRSACSPRRSVLHPRTSRVFRREVCTARAGYSLPREETRCVVNAAGGRGEAVLHHVALPRTARGASCRPELRGRSAAWRSTCGMQACKESPLRKASKRGFSGNVSTDHAMMRDHERESRS
jgi:hypothetical protein